MAYTYEYPRPAVTTDVLLLAQTLPKKILLIRRGSEPFKDLWALPGGFVDMDEDIPLAAMRELEEETGIKDVPIKQFRTYGTVDRDPRHRTISVIYTSVVDKPIEAIGMDDAAEAKWFNINELPQFAFDHELIIKDALELFRNNGCF